MHKSIPAAPAPQICPPLFGNYAAADGRRNEFDLKNSVLVTGGLRPDIVFIGDSITHFWELNAYFRKFGLVVNRGISGDQAHILIQRLEGDVMQLHPRACVMMVGINNTWCIDDQPDLVLDRLCEVLHGCYQRALEMAKNNGIPLLLCSVMPVGDRSEKGIRRNQLILKVNKDAKQLCMEHGAIYVDYHSALVDEDGLTLRDGLSYDGLHPHVIGYDHMAEVLTPLLETVLGE